MESLLTVDFLGCLLAPYGKKQSVAGAHESESQHTTPQAFGFS